MELDAPLDRLPVLVRAGGAVPVGERMGYVSTTADTSRELLLFPAPGAATTHGQVYADDGQTHAWREGEYCLVDWEMNSDATTVRVVLRTSGTWKPAWGELQPVLPAWEQRELVIERV